MTAAPKTIPALLVLLLAIAVPLAGCGSGSETASDGSTASAASNGAGPSSTGGEGSDRSIQEFGSAGSASERAAASFVLHGYLDARVERDWNAACAQLAAGISQALAQQFGNDDGKAGCAGILTELTAAVPAAALRQAAVADVGSLRIEGEQGFLLFHGAGDDPYFMPMLQEGGAWKVAAVAASPLL